MNPSQPSTLSPQPSLEEWEVLDLLTALVDKSLVVYEEDENGQTRYRLLETVRQYARERLYESGEGADLRVQHCDYFLALAEEASPQVHGPEQVRWLNTLETEQDNLRVALDFCLDTPEGIEPGTRLVGALWGLWYIRGYFGEGRDYLNAFLTRADTQEATEPHANALNGAGVLAYCQGDYVTARSRLEESLAIRRELGHARGISTVLNNLGVVAWDQGDYGSARSLFEESLAIQRELGEQRVIAGLLGNLGLVAFGQGDITAAHALHTESLIIRRELADKEGMALALVSLGYLARERGDYALARSHLVECLTLCRELGEKRITTFALEECAALAKAQGQPERAARLYTAAVTLRASIGVPPPPTFQERYDRDVPELRATLGETVFTSAYEAGRALTMEQAIEFALSEETAP